MLLREAEREGEALVMLNRYLDLAEAADGDGGDAALDHADFGKHLLLMCSGYSRYTPLLFNIDYALNNMYVD